MITDYGACCVIVPYLDLINETTISLDPNLYTGEMFHSIPPGAKNGIQVTYNSFLNVLYWNGFSDRQSNFKSNIQRKIYKCQYGHNVKTPWLVLWNLHLVNLHLLVVLEI